MAGGDRATYRGGNPDRYVRRPAPVDPRGDRSDKGRQATIDAIVDHVDELAAEQHDKVGSMTARERDSFRSDVILAIRARMAPSKHDGGQDARPTRSER